MSLATLLFDAISDDKGDHHYGRKQITLIIRRLFKIEAIFTISFHSKIMSFQAQNAFQNGGGDKKASRHFCLFSCSNVDFERDFFCLLVCNLVCNVCVFCG